MSIKKSRSYTQDNGSKVSFEFRGGKVIGVKKDGVPVNPNTDEFSDFVSSDDGLNAYNVNKYTSAKKSYEKSAVSATDTELSVHYLNEEKKHANEASIDQKTEKGVTPRQNASGKSTKSEVMSYPFDLNPKQDHFKIMRYNYVRPDINQSKGPDQERVLESYNDPSRGGRSKTGYRDRIINRAGDSVVGSELKGSVLLPMPKATDVNGVEWGKSELTISGLAALGAANFVAGRLTENQDERAAEKQARELIGERGRNVEGTAFVEGARALAVQTTAKMAGMAFGTELDADTFLARTGGKVLNPNTEMLFQGPVIRDFAFSFIMLARSQEEGRQIRKIIRFLKLGMAPKFRSTTFLKAPDIFTLHYKNGLGEGDELKTVNKFNPGGLALTTMNVDYSPNGYWSAYRDSQPVAVKMDLNFTELRPLYESDQASTPEDSVGY